MQKVWIVAGVVLVVIAALAVLMRGGSEGEKSETVRRPPAKLQESEVRTYVEVMPRFREVLERAATEYRDRSNGGTTDNGIPNPRTKITALLRRHQLDLKSWDNLRRRVEYVVSVVRFESRAEEREAALEEAIAQKEQLLSVASGTMKEQVEKDLENLKAQRNARGAPIHPEDRELALRFWPDLDRLASGTVSDLKSRDPR